MSRTKSAPRRASRPGRRPARGRPDPTRPRRIAWLVGGAVAIAVAVYGWAINADRPKPTLGSSPFTGGDLHSFVAVPGAPGHLFAGGHQAVSRSTDGGRTWSQVTTLDGADAMGWAFLDGSIWLGGHPGLEVSTDGGRTFGPRNDGLPATDIHALGGTGSLLYAASPAAGFFASLDGGTTWEIRNPAMGQSFMGAMLVDPDDPDRIVAPDMNAGVVESTDGGRTWRILGGVPGAMWVSWDPSDRRVIVASTFGTAAITRDGGATWEPIGVPAGASIVQIDPDDPTTWYAAAWMQDGTVAVSTTADGGSTWTPM